MVVQELQNLLPHWLTDWATQDWRPERAGIGDLASTEDDCVALPLRSELAGKFGCGPESHHAQARVPVVDQVVGGPRHPLQSGAFSINSQLRHEDGESIAVDPTRKVENWVGPRRRRVKHEHSGPRTLGIRHEARARTTAAAELHDRLEVPGIPSGRFTPVESRSHRACLPFPP